MRMAARSRRQGLPPTCRTAPAAKAIGSGRSSSLAAIQLARVRAKATASASPRTEGAVATTSRRAGSSRSDTRRARACTFSRTGRPSTSTRSPAARRGFRARNSESKGMDEA